ncbi:MAG: endonuclease/exonuclease/phosphatase family protein [Pseudomonadota bacterium]
MTPLTFVSLNAWGGREWESLGPWLEALVPDILCLQEVTRAPVPSPDWLTYDGPPRRIRNRSDLFADVSAILPTHQGIFAAGARGTMARSDGDPLPSEHGIALWVRGDWAITALRHGFVHGTYRMDGWGPEPVPRAMQLAQIAVASGREILVGHLHGLRVPEGKGDTPDRAAQTRKVVEGLRELRRPAAPLIFGGDFNVLPESAMLQALTHEGLIDLVTTQGHDDTRTSLYTKPVRHADYLFVSPEVAVDAFSVPANPEVSDHRPLILTARV